jgi:hypothetical protein
MLTNGGRHIGTQDPAAVANNQLFSNSPHAPGGACLKYIRHKHSEFAYSRTAAISFWRERELSWLLALGDLIQQQTWTGAASKRATGYNVIL